MYSFDDSAVRLDVLRRRAFNYRWAEVPEGVIPLTAADPDFPVCPDIIAAMQDYLDGGYLSYTPKLGLPDFRAAIARTLNARKSEGVNPDLVLPVDSAARGMFIIAQTVLKPGDEMLVFDPVDYLFKTACLKAGATPVLFPAQLNSAGRIDLSDLESYITPQTRMLGLCNPHNPWGTVYTQEDLDHILTLCAKHDIWIMNDEIWSDIVYAEQPFVSILSLGAERNQKTISVYGFSKSFGVAGLRIGAIYCQSQAVFDKLVETSDVMSTAGGIASISQIAGIACLEKGFPWVTDFLKHLQGNRDCALERLNQMPGIRCHKPSATYLLFPDVTGTGLGSEAFVDFVQREAKLALVPGTDKFFGPGAEGHVRICFATSRGILSEGLDRLERATHMLAGR
jgi:aspartate/methionine/tyrosine aminotransferase